jgi:hypothetical protein
MILPLRFSNVGMVIVLALGITTISCGGGYSSPSGGGQATSDECLCLYAVGAIHSSKWRSRKREITIGRVVSELPVFLSNRWPGPLSPEPTSGAE